MSEEPQSSPPDASERQEQLDSLIAGYIRDTEAGRTPQRQELLKQYPEFAAELTQFFGQRDRLNRLVDPILEFGDDLYQSIGPGKQLSYVGNYELLEEIARGGMGVVYKARQTTLGRIVAVKMIVAGRLANEQDVQRFKSEAQAVASLKHPQIVAIHEVGEHEGWHYFSMDYIEGHDLATALRQNLLPAKTAANYVLQLAQAIHYAHQQGILHRDLKPSNILIDQQHQVHITDFGLATRVEEDQGLTQTGQILGTPSYMSPEQAQGKRGLIGPGSDVYALGAILYECLTGRPPFRAESVIKTIEQVIHAEAASPHTLNVAIPRDLETICLKCLQKEPHKRYGTAEHLAEDLRCFLAGEPIAARPVGSAERAWRWCRRNPAVAGLMATVAASLIVGTTVSSYFAVEAGQRARAEASERRRAELAQESETLAKRDALHRLWDSYLAQARAGRLSRRPGQRFDGLQALAEAQTLVAQLGLGEDEILAMRNEAIATLVLPDIRLAGRWPGHGPPSEQIRIAFDGDLERYAQLEAENVIVVRRMSDNREMARLPPELSLGSLHDNRPYLRFSPDGKLLAIKGRETGRVKFFIWDLETHSVVGQGPAGGHWYDMALDFSPDSRNLAIAAPNNSIVFYQPDDHGTWQLQGELRPDSNTSSSLFCLRFHPQRSELVECRGATVLVRNIETGETVKKLGLNDSGASYAACWSHCGRFMVYALGTQVYLWDSVTDAAPTLFDGHTADVKHVSMNPAGNLLVSTAWDRTTRLWDPRSGRQWLHTVHYGTDFSEDGRSLGLGLAGVAMGRWEVADGSELRMLGYRLPKHVIADLDFSPDGRLLVAGSLMGLRVFELSTGEPIPTHSHMLKTETRDVQFGTGFGNSFDPDGRGILTSSLTDGVRHFPIEFDEQQQPLRIGCPRTLPLTSMGRHARSQDGTLVAAWTKESTLQIFNPAAPARQIIGFSDNSRDRFTAISPDGHWIATGPCNGRSVSVWEASTGQFVRKLDGDFLTARVDFDPLQRWLVVTTDQEQILYESSGNPTQWAVARRIPMTQPHRGAATLSPDGRLLAFSDTPSSIKLVDTTSFTEVAQLSSPDSDLIHSLRFSRDGHRFAAGTANGQVQLWDLQRIRSQLAAMDLDWSDAQDLPEMPHTKPFLTGPDGEVRVVDQPEQTWQGAPGADKIQDDGSAHRKEPSHSATMQALGAQQLAQGAKASWSPDGTDIVYGIMPYGAGLKLLDLRTRQSRRLTHNGKDPAFCPIAPGLIAYVRGHNHDEEVWVVDAQGENDRKIAVGGFPCWSGDGQTLYFQSRKDWKIRAVDMSDREEPNPQLTVVHTLPNVSYPVVSPDGRWVAYVYSGQFVFVNLASGEKTSRELGLRSGLAGWSPDSRLVGYSGLTNGADTGLWVLDVGSGELKRLAYGNYTMPAWSHDGTKIAFDYRHTGSDHEIWLVDATVLTKTEPYQPPPDQSTLPATDADAGRLD